MPEGGEDELHVLYKSAIPWTGRAGLRKGRPKNQVDTSIRDVRQNEVSAKGKWGLPGVSVKEGFPSHRVLVRALLALLEVLKAPSEGLPAPSETL